MDETRSGAPEEGRAGKALPARAAKIAAVPALALALALGPALVSESAPVPQALKPTAAEAAWWNPLQPCIDRAKANVRYTAGRGVFVTTSGYVASGTCAGMIGYHAGNAHASTSWYHDRWNARINACWPNCSNWDWFRLVTGL